MSTHHDSPSIPAISSVLSQKRTLLGRHQRANVRRRSPPLVQKQAHVTGSTVTFKTTFRVKILSWNTNIVKNITRVGCTSGTEKRYYFISNSCLCILLLYE